MIKRKSISQKTRFEVFKRDSFTCQYCGQSAPNVLLEVDHIKPVKEGGTNEMVNLITACKECNRGKGARKLSDQTELVKQKVLLDELNERRKQIEMMAKWRESLVDLEQKQVDSIAKYFDNYTGYHINTRGKQEIRRWLRKYSASEVYEAIDISTAQYLVLDKDGEEHTQGSVEKAFNYVEKIMAVKRSAKDKPYLKDLFYIRGILRNRLNYVKEQEIMGLLERAYLSGLSIEQLKQIACTEKTWIGFTNELECYM